MTGHRYWKLDGLTSADSYVAGAEVYLRQSTGGTNEVPTTSSSSTPYQFGPSVLYDGSASSWWASNSSPKYLIFDYGADITPVELVWQARPDNFGQGCTGGSIYWSDTGMSGPWTFQADFTFSSWTTNGQIQTTSVILPNEMRITEQHGFAVMLQSGLIVPEQHSYAVLTNVGQFITEQHGYAVLTNVGQFVTEQHAYAVLVPTTNTRRRQVMIGSC